MKFHMRFGGFRVQGLLILFGLVGRAQGEFKSATSSNEGYPCVKMSI